jgi:DNA-directed RNA polymerase subunit K/omega
VFTRHLGKASGESLTTQVDPHINNKRGKTIMSQLPSRTPDIDFDACAERVGGKMALIHIAAQRARDLRNIHDRHSKEDHRNFATEALLDIQNGVVGKDYGTTRLVDKEE